MQHYLLYHIYYYIFNGLCKINFAKNIKKLCRVVVYHYYYIGFDPKLLQVSIIISAINIYTHIHKVIV